MLAVDYPLLNIFWTMLFFFGFAIWIWAVIAVLGDVFKSQDIGGWGKGLWFLTIFFLPVFGVLLYVIVRGGKMNEHALQAAQARDPGIGRSTADELNRLMDLRNGGIISPEEFDREKARVLA